VVAVQPQLSSPQQVAIVPDTPSLSHSEACRIADLVLGHGRARTVVIDLKHVAEATTSAFARLVLLRRRLLQSGRDLRLVNLRDRAASLYQINRLAGVLPCA
jgi:anti-anti-sigma regulatory factor